MPQAPVVKLEGVTKRFPSAGGPVTALDRLNAALQGGQVTGVVGPDGAGKTTLLRLIAGLLPPDSGQVWTLGRDPMRRQAEGDHGGIGYMPQSFGLYEELSVAENLRLYADLHSLPAHERTARFEELLGFTGLAGFTERRAGRLSGGMKQKLGLACSLVRPPRLLLLDEPTVGVDPLSRRELWEIIHRLVEAGISLVVTTAYLDEAERCQEVMLLHRGELLEQTEPHDFAQRVAGRTFTLTGLDPVQRRHLLEELATHSGVLEAVPQGERIRIVTAEEVSGVAGLGQLLPLSPGVEYQAVPPQFEDALVTRLLEGAPAALQRGTQSGPFTATRDAGERPQGPALALSGVQRRFGDFYAVAGVSFAVHSGEIFGLLGPNGAGKSTLIRILCGLMPPSSGQVKIAGVDAGRAPAKVRGRLGYMPQRFALYNDLTPTQNLRFFSRAYGLRGGTLRSRVRWALEAFALEEVADTPSRDLPLGFKQRLALGAALLHKPDIVLLDEPTSGVDPLARRGFWHQITQLAETGVTVLVTTHFLGEAEYCDRLGIMYNGRLIALDSPDRLRAEYRDPETPAPTLEEAFIHLIEAQGEE